MSAIRASTKPSVRDEAAEMEHGKRYRSVGRITSPDFKTWSQPTLIVLEGDGLELGAPLPPTSVQRPQMDFYTNAAYKHPDADDTYFMMPAAYHHWEADDGPATMDVKLLTSRDGIIWNRHGDREPFIRRGLDGGPDGGMVMAGVWPIHTDTETWIYYGGRGDKHNEDERDGSNSGLFRAVLRRDGFVSADTSMAGGEFTTPPLTFDGSELELNRRLRLRRLAHRRTAGRRGMCTRGVYLQRVPNRNSQRDPEESVVGGRRNEHHSEWPDPSARDHAGDEVVFVPFLYRTQGWNAGHAEWRREIAGGMSRCSTRHHLWAKDAQGVERSNAGPV